MIHGSKLACCVVDTNVKKEANYELHKKFEEEVIHVRRTKDESSLRKVEILCFSCNGCHRSALG